MASLLCKNSIINQRVKLILNVVVIYIRHDWQADTYSTTNTFHLRETFVFSLNIQQNESQVHDIIGPTFTRLRINTDSVDYRRISVWASVAEQYHNDEILMRRALSESASEFESRNYGMVPTKESLVNEMLKRIKVEDEDIKVCIVCLEQLKVGAEAYRMPGSHIFHGDCIEKWLKQSHYCPICRFEMPKN
ncbi:hypothetical protein ES332_A13G086700v1 [Gossypium tomentosum]|uniref:RING-type E3 ubiquitin transferase n=1 Tax=Gossypium tomentosum TaxID=34277 RepID=A0A5D2MHX4_GOSTO|nr:hypothetical protein ES332_A13G086700v1 [Gossypium tomentosum]